MCLKWRTQLVRERSMSNVGHDKIQPLNAWFFNVKLCRNTSETTLPPPYSLSSPPSHIILSSRLGSSKASPIIPLHFSTRLDCYADTAFIFKKSHSRHSTISFTHFQGELGLSLFARLTVAEEFGIHTPKRAQELRAMCDWLTLHVDAIPQ